jgi:signal transduction histidine kinase/DNA-binding response OmpR family regulator
MNVLERSRATVLLVDDRPANLLALESALAAPDLEIVKADSGAAALRFLLRSECAVILMDVNMPGLDGYETARLIRQNERTRGIPIVFVTAFGAEDRQVLLGYESGAIDYLLKPLRPEVLRSKVAGFVALHRARLEVQHQAELLREAERREHAHAVAELELRALRREQVVQRRYQTVVEALSGAVVWLLDPVSLACTFASPSVRKVLGFTPDECQADPRLWVGLLPPGDRERFEQALRGLQPGGPAVMLEHHARRADGRLASFETTIRLLAGDDPGRLEVHGLSLDVTEAAQSRDAIAFLSGASAELARTLDVRGAAAAAARVAAGGGLADLCLVELTPAPGELERVAAHADPAREREARGFAAGVEVAHLRSLAGPALVAAEEVLGEGEADARAALARLGLRAGLAVPLVARAKRVGTLLVLAEDPMRFCGAPRAAAEEFAARLAQTLDNAMLHEETACAVRAREEFLSVASHELRTPLTALHLQVQLLDGLFSASRIDAPAGQREDLQRRVRSLARQVGRLTALVNSVLDLARARSERLTLDLDRCEAGDVVRDVAARFQEALAAEGRSLTVSIADGVAGRWDRTRLEQLLTNLVGNAVRHGGDGDVALEVSLDGGRAVITVADGGPGIAPEDQARVFDPFAQGRQGAGGGGLGLGLYIARAIAEAHGGALTLESAPGHGATFRVRLPALGVRPPQLAAGGDAAAP